MKRALLLVAAMSAACSEDRGFIDGGERDSGAWDAPPADTAAVDALIDADATPDVQLERSGRPLPVGVAPPRRILDRAAQLTGSGTTSCSHQDPPSGDGDRWCVFTVPGAVADTAELWVLDITGAAVEKPPPCDGSSPLCKRLTTKLWTASALDGPVHPYSHEFHGDTLIFYADTVTPAGQIYRGKIFAWRPGWTEARQISSDTGILCWGHPRVALAYCLENFAGNQLKPDSAELRAGPLSEGAALPLPSLGRFRPIRSDGVPAWRARLSAKGDVFALSSSDPDPAVETLRYLPVSELGRMPAKEVLRDVSNWELSRDGQRVYFERGDPDGQSDLYVADFPSGGNVTKIDGKVLGYDLLTARGQDRGIGYVTSLNATHGIFHLLLEPFTPSSAVSLFTYTDAIENLRFSSDLRFTAWVDSLFNIRIVRNSDYVPCDLNANPGHEGLDPWFLDSAGLVFWTETSLDDPERRDGYFADPEGCRGKQRFGWGVEFGIPVGDRAVVFGDEVDPSSLATTLKYAEIAGGRDWPSTGAVRIHENVAGASVLLVGSEQRFLVFRVVSGGPEVEGTYLFGPTPF